jgi:pantetheine-phosphate adenylyltransferase
MKNTNNAIYSMLDNEHIKYVINGVNIFEGIIEDINNNTHLYYHTLMHVIDLYYKTISEDYTNSPFYSNLEEDALKRIIFITCLFHDIVYNIKPEDAKYNEVRSANRFKIWADWVNTDICENYLTPAQIRFIADCILGTVVDLNRPIDDVKKTYKNVPLIKCDRVGLIYDIKNGNMSHFDMICKEFAIYDKAEIIENHLKVCKYLCDTFDYDFDNEPAAKKYVELINSKMPVNVGIYCGSFKPFHIGHLNIVEQAERIFDQVIIAKGINADKRLDKKNIKRCNQISPNFELSKVLNGRCVVDYLGSIFDLYEKYSSNYKVTFIKGFRNNRDIDYDMNQVRIIQDYIPGAKFVFIPCNSKFEHISSSAIDELYNLHQNITNYLP